MDQLPKSLTIPIGRLGAAAQNALEMARFGGLTTDEEPSRYEAVSEQRVYRAPARSRSSRGTGSIPGWSTLARPSVRRGASSAR